MTDHTTIKAVIFDWAGTTVDFGCFAPLHAFLKIFEKRGIEITLDEAREPMGLPKLDHIRAILHMERVAHMWEKAFGKFPTDRDAQDLYGDFEPLLMKTLADHTEVLNGVLETCAHLRERNIKIGSTTGYTSEMMETVKACAKKQGYRPDQLVTPDMVGHGRPAPWMIFENMKKLEVAPPSAVLKVGDTVSDIQEALSAGVWSVGVVVGSSVMGLDYAEYQSLDAEKRQAAEKRTRDKFFAAGAHYVIKDMSELPALIDHIEKEAKFKVSESSKPERAGHIWSADSNLSGRARRAREDKKGGNPYLLLTPGPLSTTQTVREAMLRDWCTWDDDYNSIIQDIRSRLVDLATANSEAYTAVLMQGSGTFSVESVIGSTIGENDKLLVLTNGAYGDRIAQIAEKLGIDHAVQDSGEVGCIDTELLGKTLSEDPAITHVAVVHCETTTGMLNDIAAVGEVVKKHGKVYIVDAMSSFGGIPLDVDALQIDFLISSANKCIQGVPGFGFVVANREELQRCEGRARSLSLDLYDQWKVMEKGGGKWRFTSPTHVVKAFCQALDELEHEGGIAQRNTRYVANQTRLVEGMRELGYEPLLETAHHSPIITSFYYPNEEFDFTAFYHALKEKGYVIYPGKISQAETFRIGNIGDVCVEDIEDLLEKVKYAS